MASMLYFPRNRSMTRYFSFAFFQLRTENFSAVSLPSVVQPVHNCATSLHLPHLSAAYLSGVGYIHWRLGALYDSDVRPAPLSVLCSDHNFEQFPCLSLQPLFCEAPLRLEFQFWYTLLAIKRTSCRSFHSTTGGPFFHCPFYGV